MEDGAVVGLKILALMVCLPASIALQFYSTYGYWRAYYAGTKGWGRRCVPIVKQDVDGMMLHFFLGALSLGGLWLSGGLLFQIAGELGS
jgi:hypothetical protein